MLRLAGRTLCEQLNLQQSMDKLTLLLLWQHTFTLIQLMSGFSWRRCVSWSFVTLHKYILTASGLGNDRRWTQSLLWLETKWRIQGASWEYSSSKGGQFIKHCKSAKLPWHRNIKLSHGFLVFCCLIVFLSFHFFVFLLAKCWKKLNEKKKLI